MNPREKLISNCFDKAQNCTTQLFKNENGIKPLASGIFVKMNTTYFLFTVAHVLEKIESEKLLYIKKNKNEFIPITGNIAHTNVNKIRDIDIGYIQIKNSNTIQLIKKHYLFLDSSKIALNFNPSTNDTLIATGFPVVESKLDISGMNSTGTIQELRHSKDQVYKYYKYLKSEHYIIDYKYKDPKSNKYHKLEEPYGNSGGGLWIIRDTETELGTLAILYLVGLLSTFINSKYYVLIAERLEKLVAEIHNTYQIDFNILDLNK